MLGDRGVPSFGEGQGLGTEWDLFFYLYLGIDKWGPSGSPMVVTSRDPKVGPLRWPGFRVS